MNCNKATLISEEDILMTHICPDACTWAASPWQLIKGRSGVCQMAPTHKRVFKETMITSSIISQSDFQSYTFYGSLSSEITTVIFTPENETDNHRMGKTSLSPLSVISSSEPDCCLMYQVTEVIQGQRRIKYTEYRKFPSQKHHNYLKIKRGKIWLCSAVQLFFLILICKFFILIVRFMSTSISKLVSCFSYTKRMENSGKKKP